MPTWTEKKSLELMQERGYLADYCQYKLGKHSKDLYGMFDVVATDYGCEVSEWREGEVVSVFPEMVGVQSTSRSNFSTRRKKILAHENYERLKGAGWRIVVHGWTKDGDLREEFL